MLSVSFIIVVLDELIAILASGWASNSDSLIPSLLTLFLSQWCELSIFLMTLDFMIQESRTDASCSLTCCLLWLIAGNEPNTESPAFVLERKLIQAGSHPIGAQKHINLSLSLLKAIHMAFGSLI